MDVLGHHPQSRPSRLLVDLGQVPFVHADVRLPPRDLQDLHFLHRPLQVLLSDASALAHVAKGVGLVVVVPDELDHTLGPPAEIGLLAEVGEGLFGSADALFDEAEFVAEGDEELAVALALEEREDEDAAEVVFGFLDLGGGRGTLEK